MNKRNKELVEFFLSYLEKSPSKYYNLRAVALEFVRERGKFHDYEKRVKKYHYSLAHYHGIFTQLGITVRFSKWSRFGGTFIKTPELIKEIKALLNDKKYHFMFRRKEMLDKIIDDYCARSRCALFEVFPMSFLGSNTEVDPTFRRMWEQSSTNNIKSIKIEGEIS